MSLKRVLLAGFLVVAGAAAMPAFAADEPDGNETEEAKGPKAGEPLRFESEGQVTIGEETIEYSVVAGEIFLKNDEDEPIASMFSIAYTKKGVEDPAERPVMFVFNGGPGSASLWLHLGTFGPKRVVVPSDATDDGAPPYPLVNNEGSILDVADLVFIDPVGTGFSRALGAQEAEDFYGVDEDADAVGRFIRRWLTENERWASPKYLAGESYGTTRAGALVSNLTGRYNDVALNGVILVSAILDFETARGDLGTVGLLPTQAAIAWYHEKVDRDRWEGDFDAFLRDARDFSARKLAPALMLGQGLPEDEYDEVVKEFSQYTGLSEVYLRRARLRVDVGRFMKELLREEGLTVGRFDGRYMGRDSDDVGETAEADPSGYAMDSAYTGAMNDYLTRTLGVKMDRDYEVLSFEVNQSWKPGVSGGGSTGPGYTNVVPGLARGMRQNSEMRVLLASGYYDLATPFFAAELSLQKPGVPQDRVERTYYPAGHMMYLHEPSLIQLGEDVRAFVEGDE